MTPKPKHYIWYVISIRKPSIDLRYVDDIPILANDINEISFLDVLIDTNNNNFTTSTYKNPLITTPVPTTLKVYASSDIKKQLLIT